VLILNAIINSYVDLAVEVEDSDQPSSSLNDFTGFVDSEFKWVVYSVLVIALCVAIFKRKWLWSIGIVIGFSVFAYIGDNPTKLIDIAEDIAKVISASSN